MNSFYRGRRVRENKKIRDLLKDTFVNINELIYPIFIKEGTGVKEVINSMPNQYRFSIDMLYDELKELKELGIKNLLIFGISDKKDLTGELAYDKNGIVQRGVSFIKENFPEFLLITDVCMCAYTAHGHCGIVENDRIVNDISGKIIAKIALSHVKAGADMVAPSDMMDGRVFEIRELLDNSGFENTLIMSYSVKYASSYYGPFREMANSKPTGDRKTYQLDFQNSRNYLDEADGDIYEGADIIMVKPALAYLDVVKDLREKISLPIAVYNVSGEYSMVKAAAFNGWIDEKAVVLENLCAMKRAGASLIITYHAKDVAYWIKKGELYEK